MKKWRLFSAVSFLAVSVLLIVLATVKWKTGTDWNYYYVNYPRFEDWSYVEKFEAFEFGYKVFLYLLNVFSSNYSFYLLFGSFFVLSFKFIVIYKKSNYLLLSCLIFFSMFLGDIFFVRQDFAISICFFSLALFYKNKAIAVPLILFGALFHISALICLVPLFFRLKISYFFIVFCFISLFVCLALNVPEKILHILINVLSEDSHIYQQISKYTNGEIYFPSGGIARSVLKILDRFGIFSILLFFQGKTKGQDFEADYDAFLYFYFFGIVVLALAEFTFPVFSRFGNYFKVFELVLIPFVFQLFKGSNFRVVMFCLVVPYYGLKLLTIIYGYWDLYYPYKSIL